jgi:hypothetical protein
MNKAEFRVEWDLHELGPKPAPAPRSLHGPTNSAKRDFALALAAGDVPANAPQIEADKAA